MSVPVLFLEADSGYKQEVDRLEAIDAARQLVGIIREARKVNQKVSINASGRLSDCLIAPNWTLGSVLVGREFQLEWDFLRGLADRSPLSAGFETKLAEMAGREAVTQSGKSSDALTWAWALGTGTASLRGDAEWQSAWVVSTCTFIDDDGELQVDNVEVRNSSTSEHIQEHADWLATLGINQSPAGGVLWGEREARFPRIRFLPRVRKDLLELSTSGAPYKSALDTLKALNDDLTKWDGASPLVYSVKVAAGEHDSRRQYCYVRDHADGKEHCFDAHAFFTGGIPGRIHFLLDPANKTLVVAYVGFKLDAPITG